MALKIAQHLFTGPFKPEETRIRKNHEPVVYAVVCKFGDPWDPRFRLIDIGESGDRDLDFGHHPRLAGWHGDSDGELSLYFLYLPRRDGHTAEDRRRLADEIRRQYDPPRGLITIAAGV